MKVLVFKSEPAGERPSADEYVQCCDDLYAARVLGNLRGGDDFCTACGPACVYCRRRYGRRLQDCIAGVIAFPSALPYILERPGDHLPLRVPPHDVLLVIHVHEQILLEAVRRCGEWGTRGIIAPIESQEWVCGATREEARRLCARSGVEVAFPKPFCTFDPPRGSLLAEFRDTLHIGAPEVELSFDGDRIRDAVVKVSAPCGATYFVAQGLIGKSVRDDLKHEIVSKRLHSYPCTSSMAWDDELGDTILHLAGDTHFRILDAAPNAEDDAPAMVRSPLGIMLPKPVSVAENVRNVERARRAILNALEGRGQIELAELRRRQSISPAALNSALLILKRAGSIRVAGGTVFAV